MTALSPPPRTEAAIATRAVEAIEAILPTTWHVRYASVDRPGAQAHEDGCLVIERGSDVEPTVLPATIVSGRPTRKDINELLGTRQAAPPVIISPFLPESTRAAIREHQGGYADASGNTRIHDEGTGLFISADGAQRDPWAGPGRPRASLRGEPAAKIVRALVDIGRDEWRVTELFEVSGVSTGGGYRVLDHLDNEALIERPARGIIRVRSWPDLIRAWSADHAFSTTGVVSRWLAPRGMNDLLTTLAADTSQPYAVTGSLAADEWAPYAPSRLAQIYVKDAAAAARAWDLRSVTEGANVLLCETTGTVPFERTSLDARGVTIVAPAQASVDLLTGPGRAPAEGQELIRWMEAHEDAWRK